MLCARCTVEEWFNVNTDLARVRYVYSVYVRRVTGTTAVYQVYNHEFHTYKMCSAYLSFYDTHCCCCTVFFRLEKLSLSLGGEILE